MKRALLVMALLAWTSAAHADVTRAQCVDTYEKSQVLRRDGKLRAAREALLVCSQKTCPAVTINDCARWLSEVEALVPTVNVAVRDSRGTDIRAQITLDGNAITTASQAIEVDPGSHHVHATTGDGREADLDFVARAGEQNRVVVVSIADPAPTAKAAPPVLAPPAPADDRPSIVPPVALTAVGVVGIGLAFGFGLHAKSEANDVRASCAPYCPDSSLDGVHRNLLLSDIGLGVGVVALAVGTYLWVRYVTHEPKGGPAVAALHF